MASQEDIRRIALALPEASEDAGHFAFAVTNKGKRKGFVWVWMERVEPKKARRPNAGVVAIRVRDEEDKDRWLASDPEVFFTEPHYAGFPAVLVRLPRIDVERLRELIVEGWRCQAPAALVRRYDAT